MTRPTRRRCAVPAATFTALATASALLVAPAAEAVAIPGAGTGTAIAADTVTIPDITGTTFDSPYDGKTVSGVPGVVTAVVGTGESRGFYFQDDSASGSGSHGLFVYTGSSTPDVAVGDSVLVSGTVDDYYPDATPDESVDLPVTEVTDATWTVRSSGNPLPDPLVLKPDTVPDTLAADAGGDSIEGETLRPSKYALDFFAEHSGELVEVDDARVVGPSDEYGELFVTDKPQQHASPRGGTVYTGYDAPNTGRIEVTGLPGKADVPAADVGDTLGGATVGPLSYSQFGGYEIRAKHVGSLTDGGIQRETTEPQGDGELAVATYNVENLSPADDASKFTRLAEGIVQNLASPDIVSLEEIQDNDGPTDDGVVAADETLTQLTDAVVAAGGPRYEWAQIDPEDGADGGQPGGNIRNVLLYNPDRVSFVDVPGGDATTPVTVTGEQGKPGLSVSPGRIDPAAEAWEDSRKPLVGEFTFQGQPVFVVSNHFNSKGGDQPLEGRYQPPARSSETQRTAQAAEVHDFVTAIEEKDADANIVVLGDLNDYQFSPALAKLTAGDSLDDLITSLPANERYSYVYQGNSQVLDHILTSPGLENPEYDVVHVNAEFADQTSDHDPQVARLTP